MLIAGQAGVRVLLSSSLPVRDVLREEALKYLGKAPFSSRPPNDAFRDGWDAAFPSRGGYRIKLAACQHPGLQSMARFVGSGNLDYAASRVCPDCGRRMGVSGALKAQLTPAWLAEKPKKGKRGTR